MHVVLLVVLPIFAWLTWWQLGRALGGNSLSWAYTFEWPLFAGYACFVWWQLIHDEPMDLNRIRSARGTDGEPAGPQDQVGWALNDKGGRRGRNQEVLVGSEADGSRTPSTLANQFTTGSNRGVDEADSGDLGPDEEDPELAEYNQYLAELNAGPDPRRW
jgi:hypothetical protein